MSKQIKFSKDRTLKQFEEDAKQTLKFASKQDSNWKYSLSRGAVVNHAKDVIKLCSIIKRPKGA